MTEVCILFPVLPDKLEALRLFLDALTGKWEDEHDRTHADILEERWFVQAIPQGLFVMVYLKGPDPTMIFSDLAVSTAPFEVWFRDQVKEITGIDLSRLPPFSMPLCIFSRSREKREVQPEAAADPQAHVRRPQEQSARVRTAAIRRK